MYLIALLCTSKHRFQPENYLHQPLLVKGVGYGKDCAAAKYQIGVKMLKIC